MFKEIPIILTADQLVERAITKAKKKVILDRDPFYKKKKTILARTESYANVLIEQLHSYVHSFPSIENLPQFYQELLQIHIDNDRLRKSLGAVHWAETTCQQIFVSQIRSLRISRNPDFIRQKQKEIYGRLSSVVHQVDNHLDTLIETQRFLQQLPTIEDIPTIVLAGYPNVGKSSLLQQLSHAKPMIAQYPFTTKEIYVGHMEKKEKYDIKRFQVIDTPGLLDRPMEKRNEIERLAIAALTHLADVIVFLLDVSETCGYSLTDQINLQKLIEKQFENVPILIVECKCDLKKSQSNNMKISSTTKEGIKELKDLLFQSYYPE
jgi:nucleolar GTP-binding protein